jgi:hypothetical protein
MKTHRVMVKEGDVAIIVCPFCHRTNKHSVTSFRERGRRNLRVRCCCEKMFDLTLEFRRHYRKPVKLLGRSINLSRHRMGGDVIIRNISMGGIGFYPFKENRSSENDLLQIIFELDDRCQTPINSKATVRNVGSDYVGCEFDNIDGFRKPLGFYLLG